VCVCKYVQKCEYSKDSWALTFMIVCQKTWAAFESTLSRPLTSIISPSACVCVCVFVSLSVCVCLYVCFDRFDALLRYTVCVVLCTCVGCMFWVHVCVREGRREGERISQDNDSISRGPGHRPVTGLMCVCVCVYMCACVHALKQVVGSQALCGRVSLSVLPDGTLHGGELVFQRIRSRGLPHFFLRLGMLNVCNACAR